MYKLEGNWFKGIAFDLHTIKSVYLGVDANGNDKYENTRSEMGELVYQLKYRNNQTVVRDIVDLLKNIKGIGKMDAIIPIPPTNKVRKIQPVYAIADRIGEVFDIEVYFDVLDKSQDSQELKSIDDPIQRQEALFQSMNIVHNSNTRRLADKKVLLVDDLYRSGSTLEVATDLLYSKANVKSVYVLTMTKTRSKR
jgi:competence protein ComFC